MERNKKIDLKMKYKSFFHLFLIFIMVGLYASPLIVHADKIFTLYPKNIPAWIDNYTLDFLFRDSIAKFHRLLLWSPVLGGGVFWLEYPVSLTYSSLFFISVLLGEVVAMNVTTFIFFVLGAYSMYYLARRVLNYNLSGSIFSSLTFSMSGLFAYLFENGVFYCRGTLLLPLLFAFFIKAKEKWRYAILSSMILGFMLLEISLFSAVIVLFLFLYAISESVCKKGKRIFFEKRYIVILISVCLYALLLSAFKILPSLKFFLETNRISGAAYPGSIKWANTPGMFFQRLFLPHSSGPGTMYLGFMPVLLCILTLVFYFKEAKRLFLLLVIFIMLSFGPHSPIDLHRFLWHLPFFKSIIEISKYYALIIVFLISLLAGKFFNPLETRFKKIKILSLAIILFTYCNLFISNIGYFNSFNTAFKYEPPKGDIFHVRAFNVHREDESVLSPLLYFLAKKNIGIVSYTLPFARMSNVNPRYYLLPRYAFLMPATSLLVVPNPEYKGEVFFLNTENKAAMERFEPNAISVKVSLDTPDRLIINQNFDKYWKSDKGNVDDYNGLLSVKFDDIYEGDMGLTYFPAIFFLGLALSFMSWTLGIFILIRNRNVY